MTMMSTRYITDQREIPNEAPVRRTITFYFIICTITAFFMARQFPKYNASYRTTLPRPNNDRSRRIGTFAPLLFLAHVGVA